MKNLLRNIIDLIKFFNNKTSELSHCFIMQLLISWLLISWLMICSIHLVIWNELIDIFQYIDCIFMYYIVILILKTVQKSRQILLSQKWIKILSKCERWELNLLSCKIILLKLILWMIILLKFSDLLIEKLISLLFSLKITLKLKWLIFHVSLSIFVLSESGSCQWDKKMIIMWWTESRHETFIFNLFIRKWEWLKTKLIIISVWALK